MAVARGREEDTRKKPTFALAFFALFSISLSPFIFRFPESNNLVILRLERLESNKGWGSGMGEEDREIEALGRFIRKQESYTIIGVCGRERRRWVVGGGRREREGEREK